MIALYFYLTISCLFRFCLKSIFKINFIVIRWIKLFIWKLWNTVEKIPKYYEEFASFKVLNFMFWLNSSRKNIESSNFGRSSRILFSLSDGLKYWVKVSELHVWNHERKMISKIQLWDHDSKIQSVKNENKMQDLSRTSIYHKYIIYLRFFVSKFPFPYLLSDYLHHQKPFYLSVT